MDISKFIEDVAAGKLNEVSDKNDLFVLQRCTDYLKRHFERYSRFDSETLKVACWILGDDMVRLGSFLLSCLKGRHRDELEEELKDCDLDPDDYADTLSKALRQCRHTRPRKFVRQVTTLLQRCSVKFRYKGRSEIEKNILSVQMMFGLTDCEVRFAEFLFITDTYSQAEEFFSNHLECHKYSGRKYLVNILAFSNGDLYRVISGTMKRIGLLEIDKWGICMENEFIDLIQNPSDQSLLEKYFSKVPPGVVPLRYYFTVKEQTQYILGLLETKSETATHILLYGPPGTGKTSFARSLLNRLDEPAYEIVRGDENTTQNRRVAITACLNMTGSERRAVILVDEADNLLNTQASWFMRGETQDKGWLNELLEKPGTCLIWITNQLHGIEDSVLRRFAYSLYFKPFNRRQRVLLWENIVRRNRCKRFFDKKVLRDLANNHEANAGVIDLSVKKTVEKGISSKTEFRREIEMALQAYETLQQFGEKPSKRDRIENQFSLKGLNVNGELELILGQLMAFNEHLRREDQSIVANMNLLFYGPPGTGKSELARYVAIQLDRKTICKRVSDLQSMYVGEGEKNIKQAFSEAESEEAVLIIDEADSLLFSRDRAIRSWEISFTNEFLTRMESFSGILICTTNRLKDLDQASLRRFIYKLEFDYLKPEGNIIFYEMFLRPLAPAALSTKLNDRLEALKNLTPGDFKVVRNRYCFHRKEDISHQTLIEVLENEAKFKNIHKKDKAIGF